MWSFNGLATVTVNDRTFEGENFWVIGFSHSKTGICWKSMKVCLFTVVFSVRVLPNSFKNHTCYCFNHTMLSSIYSCSCLIFSVSFKCDPYATYTEILWRPYKFSLTEVLLLLMVSCNKIKYLDQFINFTLWLANWRMALNQL